MKYLIYDSSEMRTHVYIVYTAHVYSPEYKMTLHNGTAIALTGNGILRMYHIHFVAF